LVSPAPLADPLPVNMEAPALPGLLRGDFFGEYVTVLRPSSLSNRRRSSVLSLMDERCVLTRRPGEEPTKTSENLRFGVGGMSLANSDDRARTAPSPSHSEGRRFENLRDGFMNLGWIRLTWVDNQVLGFVQPKNLCGCYYLLFVWYWVATDMLPMRVRSSRCCLVLST